MAQRFVERTVDRGRLTRATIAGTVSHGPQLHYWTLFLENVLPGAGLRPLLTKIALDQTFFSLYLNAGACPRLASAHRSSSPPPLTSARTCVCVYVCMCVCVCVCVCVARRSLGAGEKEITTCNSLRNSICDYGTTDIVL